MRPKECDITKLDKSKFIKIALICLFCVFQFSCKKDKSEPFDFRSKYIGLYQVKERISSYGFIECGEPYSREKDTIIEVINGNTDSTIIVLGREVWLDSLGYFDDYHYGLRLWNDSIRSYFMNGGLGCGHYEVYEGYRISEFP